ncbi:polysaccharide lyase [Hyalangium rubrum]|uniref:Heparin lyase I family protein n=1 Tax=Hyalangium rubrum TaxID=3103134 RepID=A0ABU5H3R3_9BACT|nr:heparin lyase I family protein [Hyalangium sp. s54d21]MDY7227443.1 heparin lyase I family protein [Hyalangium sp. s54d21]
MRFLSVWLVTLAVSGPALAGVVWRGDFETGNRSQYSGVQMVSADRLQVVTSPVAEGRYALKATVVQGDDPIDSSGNRNELFHLSNETAGTEYYYRWKVMFAPDYPSERAWQVFTQWHHDGCCGSPPVEFHVYGEEMRLTLTSSVTPWTAPLTRGVWHEFIFHVKWSADANTGFIELWHNREKVVPRTNLATMYAGTKNYLKLGLYRKDTIVPVGVVYHDAFIKGTQLADVLPPAPPDAGTPPPDAGTPDAGLPPAEPDPSTPAPEAPTSGGETTPGGTPETGESPPGGVPEIIESGTNTGIGCSAAGSPLAALALLGLLGALRARYRR